MKRSAALLSLLLACGGGTVSQVLDGQISGEAHLSGRRAGERLEITAIGPSSASAAADDSGHYAFTGLKPGRYVLVATAPSTLEQAARVSVDLAPGEAAAAPALSLTGAGSVRGRVRLSPDRAPGAVATLRATGTTASALTDLEGAFLLERVPAGTAQLYAELPGHSLGTATAEVRRGEETRVADILVLPLLGGTSSIRGTARLTGSPPGPGIAIEVQGTGVSGVTGADGRYVLEGIPAGFHDVIYRAPGYADLVEKRILIAGASPLELDEATLTPGALRSRRQIYACYGSGEAIVSSDGRWLLAEALESSGGGGCSSLQLLIDTAGSGDATELSSLFPVGRPFTPDSQYLVLASWRQVMVALALPSFRRVERPYQNGALASVLAPRALVLREPHWALSPTVDAIDLANGTEAPLSDPLTKLVLPCPQVMPRTVLSNGRVAVHVKTARPSGEVTSLGVISRLGTRVLSILGKPIGDFAISEDGTQVYFQTESWPSGLTEWWVATEAEDFAPRRMGIATCDQRISVGHWRDAVAFAGYQSSVVLSTTRGGELFSFAGRVEEAGPGLFWLRTNSSLSILDLASQKRVALPANATVIGVSPSGTVAYLEQAPARLTLADVKTGRAELHAGAAVTSSSSGELLVVTSPAGALKAITLSTGRAISLGHGVLRAISASGRHVAVTSAPGSLRLIDLSRRDPREIAVPFPLVGGAFSFIGDSETGLAWEQGGSAGGPARLVASSGTSRVLSEHFLFEHRVAPGSRVLLYSAVEAKGQGVYTYVVPPEP